MGRIHRLPWKTVESGNNERDGKSAQNCEAGESRWSAGHSLTASQCDKTMSPTLWAGTRPEYLEAVHGQSLVVQRQGEDAGWYSALNRREQVPR